MFFSSDMQSSSSRILSLIKQAKQTFANIITKNDLNYEQNDHIDSLQRSMNKLTKYDLNFTLFDHLKHPQTLNSIDQNNLDKFRNSNAPVFYMKLYEDQIISVGIFIIKSHHRIPVHDHPHMRIMFYLRKILMNLFVLNMFQHRLIHNRKQQLSIQINRIFMKFMRIIMNIVHFWIFLVHHIRMKMIVHVILLFHHRI